MRLQKLLGVVVYYSQLRSSTSPGRAGLTIDKANEMILFVLAHHEFLPKLFNLLPDSLHKGRQARPAELKHSFQFSFVLFHVSFRIGVCARDSLPLRSLLRRSRD